MRVYFVDGEMVREFDSKGERIKYNAKETFRKTREWAKKYKKEVAFITTTVAITGIRIIGTKVYRKLNPTNIYLARKKTRGIVLPASNWCLPPKRAVYD